MMPALTSSTWNLNRESGWRLIYLLLVLLRIYFALSPSYLHPDEHFQGPEIIAGNILSYPSHKTWEFTSAYPIRSVFSLWPVYGIPMLLLRFSSQAMGRDLVKASVVFKSLRMTMFFSSLVLEDRAIYELVEVPRHRRLALLLISSSYVTWTWQVHTFSNSIETLVVLWSLVIIKRLTNIKHTRSIIVNAALLAILLVFGLFNRITFPAFIVFPALQLVVRRWYRPELVVTMACVGIMTGVSAVVVDTLFYAPNGISLSDLLRHLIITPMNNALYNSQMSNLALHGIHPYYQHFFVNLPLLIGPAVLLVINNLTASDTLVAAVSGTFLLSCFRHQEARFLLPAVPLLLSSIRLPQRLVQVWITLWISFNLVLGVILGVYHQGGIVPTQLFLAQQQNISKAYWWKTYSPPTWLLGGYGTDLKTVDLMNLDENNLETTLCGPLEAFGLSQVLVAPSSAVFLDAFTSSRPVKGSTSMKLVQIWIVRQHLNFDDLDISEEGLIGTVQRVVGRRGLGVWEIQCENSNP